MFATTITDIQAAQNMAKFWVTGLALQAQQAQDVDQTQYLGSQDELENNEDIQVQKGDADGGAIISGRS